MDWKFIEESNKLYRGLHYLKNRDLSILEFQMRIFDIASSVETPLIEKVRFLRIIHENLKEFTSIRLPDASGEIKSQLIHTIEAIYRKVGQLLIKLAMRDHFKLSLLLGENEHEIVLTNNFKYIYTGESSYEVANEIGEMIETKKRMNSGIVFYCGKFPSHLKYQMDIVASIKIPGMIFGIGDVIHKLEDTQNPKFEYPPFAYEKIEDIDYYTKLREEEILFRCPYEPYDIFLNFLSQMADNPHITHIMITLYRTAKCSRVIDTLFRAASNGKEVYVYIEPTARGNEKDNVQKILSMKPIGIHVACSYFNYKVHAKLCCAIADDGTVYSHIGTGNYNEDTAKLYTDFHLLTTNPQITERAVKILWALFTKELIPQTQNDSVLYSSPTDFRAQINKLIERQTQRGEHGQIWIKCNSLCDCAIIDKLYHAADNGVDVRIICRTGCSMTYHKNITIRSKVGRFLEHDRFYIFGNQGYISSADLLLRNINKRVEVLCQVSFKNAVRLYDTFLELWDSHNIHEMMPDGTWKMRV